MGKIKQFIQAGTVAVALGASAFSLNAWARDSAPTSPAAGASAPEHRHHHGREHGHGGGMGLLPLGGRHLDRMLDEVKATDAQRTQIKSLAQAAAADLKPLHESTRALHQQSLTLFAQPQVDAAAAEKLRQQMLASHDAMSKRVLQAALDISRVLTPEQRAQLVAKLQKFHERRGQEAHARLEQ